MNRDSENLNQELEELFDIRNAKIRHEKKLNIDSMAAQRDIRVLTHMFRDGIPDITLRIGTFEVVKWDSDQKRLLLIKNDEVQVLEGASRETMVRVRPHLSLLVKAAKDFYSND